MLSSFLQTAVTGVRGPGTQMTQHLKASGQAVGTGWSLAGGKTDGRAEKYVHSARLRLKASSRFARETELAASIVHQLNQPLASMLANTQAAKRWLTAESPSLMEAIASIDRIVRDAHAAVETMKRIRAIFKQEHLDKEEVSVIAIVSDAVRFVREDIGKRKIPIECLR
jgi:signal transduction histidine kinase